MKKMPSKSFEAASLLVLLVSAPLLAAKFWESKEFTTWSQKECMELLNKSPWTQSLSFGSTLSARTMPADAPVSIRDAPTEGKLGEQDSTVVFQFRALTAKPIRLALMRLQMLKKPDDAALREQAAKIDEEPAGKEIAIQVSYQTVPQGSSAVHDLHSYFLQSTWITFRDSTSLASEKSGIVPVARYLPPSEKQANPLFIFPRVNEKGEPYFTGEEKSIALMSEFEPTINNAKQRYKIYVKLNPREMKFQNAFAF